MRRNFFHLMRQFFFVTPCRRTKRFGSRSGSGRSRQAPPADRSMIVQPMVGPLGPTMMVAVFDTRPDGLTRACLRRLSGFTYVGMGKPDACVAGSMTEHF